MIPPHCVFRTLVRLLSDTAAGGIRVTDAGSSAATDKCDFIPCTVIASARPLDSSTAPLSVRISPLRRSNGFSCGEVGFLAVCGARIHASFAVLCIPCCGHPTFSSRRRCLPTRLMDQIHAPHLNFSVYLQYSRSVSVIYHNGRQCSPLEPRTRRRSRYTISIHSPCS